MSDKLTRTDTPIPRKIPFEFPSDMNPDWHPDNPELSAMINGASMAMPYLEPFLIKTMRDSVNEIDDPAVAAEGRAFSTQEQFHYRTHRTFNEVVKANGYEELSEVEDYMKASYKKLLKRSLQTRLAYTAGFESMTLGVTKWLIEDRVELFANADTRAVSFVLWHMVEETEHKCVAFDVYQALYGKSPKAWFYRSLGVFHGSLDVVRFSMRGYKTILKKNGLWKNRASRWRLAKELANASIHIFPFLLRAALPGHSPRQESDPQWVLDWLAGHLESDENHIPLVDTKDPEMPVPFDIQRQAA